MGDIFLTTDNRILINKCRNLKAINCVQKKANKVKITEDELIKSNKNGFGNNVGTITNRTTSMFSVQSQFPMDSEEFKILDYRIKSSQIIQQNCLDAIKGIIAVPMPKSWYDNKANKILETDTDEVKKRKMLYSKIVADRKPYFFIYIYPELKRKYTKFMDSVKKKCLIQFGVSLNELINKEDKNEEELNFIEWYDKKIPVEVHDCTMNRLCRKVESLFDGYVTNVKKSNDFDYTIMKSEHEYEQSLYYSIKDVYAEYLIELQDFTYTAKNQKLDKDIVSATRVEIIDTYKRRCESICSNKYELCNIVLDMCYKIEKSKKFAWDMCGDTIIENLLNRNGNTFNYYQADENGSVEFAGVKYKKVKGETR